MHLCCVIFSLYEKGIEGVGGSVARGRGMGGLLH